MEKLLTIRDEIKNFCSKYDKYVSPLCRFILAVVMFGSINSLAGGTAKLGMLAVLVVSLVCAFLSQAFTLAVGGLLAAYEISAASIELGITFAVIFIIMYCVYIRFFPKASWIIMYMPFLYIIKLPFVMPILAGMLAGPAGIVPAAFGCVFYYFMVYAGDYMELTDAAEGYKYMFQSLISDKTLLLTVVVFAVAIIVTWAIYKMSFAYSWYVALIAGGLTEIIFFLIGAVSMETDISLVGALLGSVLAVFIAVVVQFFKAVVDYSRVENTQFEDDEYYYYVKAVPKVVSEAGRRAGAGNRAPAKQRPQERSPRTGRENPAGRRPSGNPGQAGRRGESTTGSTR